MALDYVTSDMSFISCIFCIYTNPCLTQLCATSGADETLDARGQQLLQLYKEAKILSLEKWQTEEEQSNPGISSKKK